MNFYEHTLIAKQNLSQKDVDNIEKKYEDLICFSRFFEKKKL